MNPLAGYLVKKYVYASTNAAIAILTGFQPLPAGQKRVKEDWENIWYIGMFGTMAFAAVMLYYKPDTRCVILRLYQGVVFKSNVPAYKHGRSKKRRKEWKRVGRSTDTSHHRRVHKYISHCL
jgi:hypothetical protein